MESESHVSCNNSGISVQSFAASFAHRSLISRGRGGRQAGLKLWRARSRLYQRRFLQPKHHFSAFFKSYKIITPSQRCKFKILRFFQFFRKILRFSKILQNFAEIKLKSVIFHRNLCRILLELLGNLRKLPDVSVYLKKIKNCEKIRAGRQVWPFDPPSPQSQSDRN